MGLFSGKSLDSFDKLFLDQLQDLYDAEKQLVKALPLMSKAAQDSALKSAFDQHLRETQNQVARLERVFSTIGETPKGKTCAAMKGLVAEGQEVIDASGDPDVKDAGLIAAAQRVEHYEIAAYGTARAFAQRLGKQDAARLLQESLDEEGATDKRLTQLAESSINRQAMASARH
jgi:ferritin-like metal-binding protein YciE